MAKRPSERYELVESLNRFSRFGEAFPVVTPVAMQRRSFLRTVLHVRACSSVDLARRQITVRSRARGMKSHDIADELGRMGAA